MAFSAEYRVVDFPEPVGPVTRKIPSGKLITCSKIVWSSEKKPSWGRPKLRLSLSRIRITMLSPCTVGRVETRRSITFLPTFTLMRPSRGTRFSARLTLAINLVRDRIEGCRRLGGSCCSINLPSIRKRIRNFFSKGSI